MNTMRLHARIRQRRLRDHMLTGLGRGLWRALAGSFQASAAARQAQGQVRRVARETELARALAERYQNTDRGFAADLRAAVARHERSNGVDVAANKPL